MRSSQAKDGQPGKHLPRKCAVIRRTYPEDGVEKTELRFVSYKRPTGELDGAQFFQEVEAFLKEQMEDMDNKKKDTSTTETESRCPGHLTPAPSTPTLNSRSQSALHSTHHEINCANSEALKRAIPSLERLSRYYHQMAKETKDPQYTILKMTADGVLKDTQKTLVEGGGAGQDLMQRIQMLNKIQMSDDTTSGN